MGKKVLRLTAAAALALGTLGVTGAAPASAHAPCSGATHSDYHVWAGHNDTHSFVRWEYSWHYHWWSGSNHQHKHVRFRNVQHGDSYFTANC